MMPRTHEAERYRRKTYDVQVYDNATWTRIAWFCDHMNLEEVKRRVTTISHENGLEFEDVSYEYKLVPAYAGS